MTMEIYFSKHALKRYAERMDKIDHTNIEHDGIDENDLVKEEKLKKEHPENYKVWRLQQILNHGLGKEKVSEKLVRKHWKKLYLDPEIKRFLEFLLWPKKTSLLKSKSKS